MKPVLEPFYRIPIRVRLVLTLGVAIAIAGAGMLAWAASKQRDLAIEQSKAFAASVHQLTLAGLTAMMMTGNAAERALFLDQIQHSSDIRRLRVVRGEAVVRQYGDGVAREHPSDPLEQQVLWRGEPVYEVQSEGGREYLKAVLPAIGSTDYLGKNCLGCHNVPAGTVLGAVTLEIALDRTNAAVADFRLGILGVALLAFVPLALLSYFAVSRSVSRPLRRLADNLDAIAHGEADLDRRLPVRGEDEIATATAAFNQVLAKAAQMIGAERIATDVFDHALEGILVTDAKGTIVKVNAAFSRTTGYSAEEAIGKNPRILQSGQHDEAFYKAFWESIQKTGQWQGDIWNKRKDGEVYPEWLTISCVRDAAGHVQNYVAIFSDITERKRQEALIAYQAYHDALTGLPNRVLFKDRLEQAIAIARRRNGALLSVMFLDLDRFKMINDTLGHKVGDQLLKEVAQRLRDAVREADTVARLGGDEFTVLLPEISEVRNAEAVAAKILEATRRPYHLNGKDLFVTSSIGVSVYPEHGKDAETLMKNADTAMYYIKDQGRAGYRIYDAELGARVSRHLQLESDLHKALKNGELKVVYQPLMSLGGKGVTGVEALLRWQHPRLGTIPAREFLALAEETGLIVPAGAWVLHTACAQAAAWLHEGRKPLLMTVNLSPKQFLDDNLEMTVQSALTSSGLPPEQLELEITEGLAMRDVEGTISILKGLSDLGVRLAIAEFGMGFHSVVNDLKRMPIQSVKIDRALVRELNRDPEAFGVVSGMVSVTRNGPGMNVVAVGVENLEQLEMLRTMRCDHVQGRLIGKPLPADEMAAMMDA